MAKTMAVAFPKGGTGKTATATAFAWLLGQRGLRVLAVDLDQQMHLTQALGVDPLGVSYSVADWLLQPEVAFAPTTVPIEGGGRLHLVPGSLHSVGLDVHLQEAARRTAGFFTVRNAIARVAAEYDWILLDCPPGVGSAATLSAIVAAPVLAPVEATRLTVRTLDLLTETVRFVRQGAAPRAEVLAYLPTRCPPPSHVEYQGALADLRERAGRVPVLSAEIPLATAVARAMGDKASLFGPEYRGSRAPAAYEAALNQALPLWERFYQTEETAHG